MKKKLIAMAVAGLASSAALAQTNVTMYGVLDLAYVYSSGSAGIGWRQKHVQWSYRRRCRETASVSRAKKRSVTA
jgi:predicted porin